MGHPIDQSCLLFFAESLGVNDSIDRNWPRVDYASARPSCPRVVADGCGGVNKNKMLLSDRK